MLPDIEKQIEDILTQQGKMIEWQQTIDETFAKLRGVVVKIHQRLDALEKRQSSQKFVPPTRQEVQTFLKAKDLRLDIDKWFDHYESNGWMCGKAKMKDWRPAVRRAAKDWAKPESNGKMYTQDETTKREMARARAIRNRKHQPGDATKMADSFVPPEDDEVLPT